jgi:beta-N-acetylhexosaminidase
VTLKHFPGLGRVIRNTDYTPATDTVTTVNDPYLRSFQQGVDAGADFVLVAIATYTHIDPIVSDDLGATAAVANVPAGDRALAFLSAGGDLVTSKTVAATQARVLAVRSRAAAEPTFRARVNDATLRVLRAKQAWSLLPC